MSKDTGNNYAALALKKLGESQRSSEQRKPHQTSAIDCPTCREIVSDSNGIKNEHWLQEQIELVWGEHGAHAELFRDILGRLSQASLASLRHNLKRE